MANLNWVQGVKVDPWRKSIFLLQTHCAPCSTIRKKTNARFLSDCFLKAQPALLHQYNPRHNLEENILQKGKLAYLTSFCYVSQILTPILLQRNATKHMHLNKACCCQKRDLVWYRAKKSIWVRWYTNTYRHTNVFGRYTEMLKWC